ncbi:hypothetical protein HYALB_00012199 [Hymenoscyphus albidus]|uniref:Uncharacterized protein n=1 Tax=Hymenoscyphus albidus TaxID=595503 RepID=A0A9N9Q6V3_9HELO|nr:hypothetical protein HYALB_00012199 [Hymenoscyphus albidus]
MSEAIHHNVKLPVPSLTTMSWRSVCAKHGSVRQKQGTHLPYHKVCIVMQRQWSLFESERILNIDSKCRVDDRLRNADSITIPVKSRQFSRGNIGIAWFEMEQPGPNNGVNKLVKQRRKEDEW